ncbi:MAG TPA: ABC transporter ATP-binding protein [Ktedonobacteraceae bacterium]
MQPLMRGPQEQASAARSIIIEVEHLSHMITTRAKQTSILNDLAFLVPEQSLFAITGPSGSGKSTLLHLLTGIDHATSGRILFAGQELRAMNEDALARWRGRHVGIVFQFFQLIPTLTALENVLLALELGGGGGQKHAKWRERALQCLDMARVSAFAHRLPGELSGGEQQRVAIARALANDPPVIVADEPTGNLDSHTAHEVFEMLASFTHYGKTIIYVTRDHALAGQASAGIQLLDGQFASSWLRLAVSIFSVLLLIALSAGLFAGSGFSGRFETISRLIALAIVCLAISAMNIFYQRRRSNPWASRARSQRGTGEPAHPWQGFVLLIFSLSTLAILTAQLWNSALPDQLGVTDAIVQFILICRLVALACVALTIVLINMTFHSKR